MYEAFGRGDVPVILERLAEDVAWEQWTGGNSAAEAGIPYLTPQSGRAGVGEFLTALQALEFHAFEPTVVLADERHVAVLIRLDVTVRATGVRFQDDEVHLWTFNDAGQVTSLRHFLDTGKHINAARTGG